MCTLKRPVHESSSSCDTKEYTSITNQSPEKWSKWKIHLQSISEISSTNRFPKIRYFIHIYTYIGSSKNVTFLLKRCYFRQKCVTFFKNKCGTFRQKSVKFRKKILNKTDKRCCFLHKKVLFFGKNVLLFND